ncbi:hypothetical protein CDAR_50091 [Caerostris darwini]|uniref:Uncharacterized protein n=1 Tax=Caerostris darwini TaxID=1538125 RepID=A0AAV4UWT4_9ARAC|nr:hypothetical protein CDAR_50091 [Caerostris darwini]
MAAVGFEPTPPQRLVPKTSALDHSATLPTSCFSRFKMKTKFFRFTFRTKNAGHATDVLFSRFKMKTKFFRSRQKKKATRAWQRWDSNPRLLRDWCLKPAP